MVLVGCNSDQSPKKIADYLYVASYEGFDCFGAAREFGNAYRPVIRKSSGCSQVRRANFVGRNYDSSIDRKPSTVVIVNGSDECYSSVGVVTDIPLGMGDVLLPLWTTDGINEKGLYVGRNSVPAGETDLDPELWRSHNWGHGAAMTKNDTAGTVCTSFLVRFVLDKASSVDEALELVDGINWYDPSHFPDEGDRPSSFQWMISDAKSNAVIGFYGNELKCSVTENIDEPSYSTIITNFSALLAENRVFQTSGRGYERFDCLKDSYFTEDISAQGMKKLMEKVWFSKVYELPPSDAYFMATDYAGTPASDFTVLSAEELYHNKEILDNYVFMDIYNSGLSAFHTPELWHVDSTPLWITRHTSIYSLDRLSLSVLVNQGLDGQKKWLDVSVPVK